MLGLFLRFAGVAKEVFPELHANEYNDLTNYSSSDVGCI